MLCLGAVLLSPRPSWKSTESPCKECEANFTMGLRITFDGKLRLVQAVLNQIVWSSLKKSAKITALALRVIVFMNQNDVDAFPPRVTNLARQHMAPLPLKRPFVEIQQHVCGCRR